MELVDSKWKCTQCTLENPVSRLNCEACGFLNPHPTVIHGSATTIRTSLSAAPQASRGLSVDMARLDDISPRDNYFESAETFDCPYEGCNHAFPNFEQFYEHMEGHQSAHGKAQLPIDKNKDNYQAQYSECLTKLVNQKKITANQAAKEFKYMEKSLAKEDTITKTKGICPLVKSHLKSKYKSYLAEGVDFYYSSLGDAGWGCGYRNVQMISSYLFQYSHFKKALFGDKNYIPSVTAIQGWIEKAWFEGFDKEGAEHFGGLLSGTRGKIGTNDVAALFRSFGIKMDVCDFISRRLPEDMIVAQQIALQGTNEVPQEYEPNLDMVAWICAYFEKGKASKFLPPLYLQHDGHSRTVIGCAIEKKTHDVYLLIFDPALSGPRVKSSLQNKTNWGYVIKKADKFFKQKYQIGYITTNQIITDEKQFQQLKRMDFVAEAMSGYQ